jgi:hypothetical protein
MNGERQLLSTRNSLSKRSQGAQYCKGIKLRLMVAPNLPGILQRLERAQLNYRRVFEEFAEHNGCALIADLNEGTFRVQIAAPLPGWQLLVSDIVCDMRFLLDNLAYELVIANTTDPPPNSRGIEFPVFAKRADFMKTDHSGTMTRASGRKKIENMNPWVQRMIEAIQPYNNAAGVKDDGFYVLNEMCNTYKHRLLVPIPQIAIQNIDVRIHAVGCTVTDIVQVQPNLRELQDGEVVATFKVEGLSDGATVSMETQPTPYLAFPAGSAAESLNVLDLCLQGILVVRAIIAALTEIQWGDPVVLPETPPDFVMPLAVTLVRLYGP